jgi:uncharacterized protein YcnI
MREADYMLKKLLLNSSVLLICSLLLAGIASAHVVVYPVESTQGSYEKFTVRVPSEKDIPTVKVEVKFPLDSVAVSRFEPKAGWNYQISKDADGKVTGVVWTASGEGLSATEFGDFNMQGKVADAAKEITWKAYQTYKDGSVVEWVGAEGSKNPASVTKVKAKPTGAAADSHGATVDQPASTNGGASNTALYLSIAAVVLAALALIMAMRRPRNK